MFEEEAIVPMVRKHVEIMKAVAVAVLSVLLIVFAILPTFKKAQVARGSLQKEKSKLEELSDKVVVLENLDESILNERVEVLNRVLPPKKDLTAYLTTLDGMSRELGLSLGEISLSPGDVTDSTKSAEVKKVVKYATLSSLETEISLVGQEEDVYALLRQIEGVAPLMQVKDVSMSSSYAEGDVFSLSLRLAMLYSDIDSLDYSGISVISLFDENEEKLFQELTQYRTYQLDDIPYVEPGGVDEEDLFKPPQLRLSETLLQLQESPQASESPDLQ